MDGSEHQNNHMSAHRHSVLDIVHFDPRAIESGRGGATMRSMTYPPSLPPLPARHWLASIPAWTFVFLAATAAGIFFSLQIYYSNATFRSPVSWGQAFYW